MTSYSQSDYYYNNENDALSCNSRPISSTIHRKSSNNYERHHTDIMYDSYGNSRCSTGVVGIGIDSTGSMSALADETAYNTPPSLYSTTNATNIAAVTTESSIKASSTAIRTRAADGTDVRSCGRVYEYRPMISNTTAYTTTSNDNMMYHRDVYSSYNIECTEDNMFDKSDYGCDGGSYDYWENAAMQKACNGGSSTGRHTSLGSTKMLPKLPIKHSSSMLDGMYTSNNQQQYDMTTTPPVVPQYAKSRLLPLTGAAASYNVSSGGGGEMGPGYSLQYNQLNGHNNYVAAAAVGGVAAGGGVVAADNGGGKILPPAPLHAMPHPQSCSVDLQRYFFEDGTTATAAQTAVTPNNIYIRSNYDNTTINNYNNHTNTTTTTSVGGIGIFSPTANTAFDAFYHSMPQRPHTSMAPLNYSDEYSCYAYNSAENLSIFSETTAAQQQLQQHRKHSIIMAMTTASVIASGETRITPQQRKQQQQQKLSSTTAITNNANNTSTEIRSSYVFECDSSGVAAPKRQQFGSIATTETTIIGSATSDAYNYEMSRLNNSSRYAAANPQKSTTTNAAVLSSEMLSNMSMLSSSTVTVSSFPSSSLSAPVSTVTTTTTTSATTTTARKLPKRLPTPKHKNTTTVAGSSSSNNRIISSTCSKQLPKLPQPKVNLTNVEDKSNFSEIKPTLTIYAISPTTVSTPAAKVASISLTQTSLSSTTSFTSTPETLSSIYATAINVESDAQRSAAKSTSLATTTTHCNNNTFTICSINNNNKNNNNNNLIVHEDLQASDKTNKSFALPLSISSTSSAIVTSSSSVYAVVDSSYTLSETSLTTDKIMTPSFDIADYLKPYALSTYCVSSNKSSTYNATAYALPPSSVSSLYTSPVISISTTALAQSLTTTMTTISSSLSSTTEAPVYAINSTATLSSYPPCIFANDTVSNFSNISKLTNSNVSKNLNSSDSYLEALSTSVTSTVTSSSTVAGTVSFAAPSPVLSTSIMSYINTSQHPIATSTSVSSSSTLLLSSYEYKSDIYKDSSSYNTTKAQNFPLDIITTTTTATASGSLTTETTVGSRFLNVLDSNTTTTSMTTITTSGSSNSPSATMATDSYTDYLKKLNLDNSSTELTTDKKELPTYITDFLNCDYISKYESLTLDYQYKDSSVENADKITSATPTIETTCNDYIEYTRKLSLKTIDTTTQAETTPSPVKTTSTCDITTTKAENYVATYPEMFYDRNAHYNSQIPPVEPTLTTNDSIMSFGYNNAPSPVFDDNFYDSYNVDLSTLTAPAAVVTSNTTYAVFGDVYSYSSILSPNKTDNSYMSTTTEYLYTLPTITSTAITTTGSAQQQEQQHHKQFDTATSIAMTTTISGSSVAASATLQSGYYKPASSASTTLAVTAIASTSVTTTPQKTAANAAAAAAGKASSMFGGLSKGLKGGLDGVLSGVGATITDTTKQQMQEQSSQSSKKSSFGFGLASKLVPNVGGLLTSTTSSAGNKSQQQQQQQQSQPQSVISGNTVSNTKPAILSTFAYDDFTEPAATSADSNAISYDYYASSAIITTASTPTNDYTNNTTTAVTTYAYTMQPQDDDLTYPSKGLLYTNGGSGSSQYDADGNMLLNSGLVMYGKVDNDEMKDNLLLMQKQQQNQQQFDFEDKYEDYDEYGAYSDYSYDKQVNDIAVVTTASGEILGTSTTIGFQQPCQDFQFGKILDPTASAATAAEAVTICSGQSLAKKTTSSLLSSLTSVVQPSQQQQQTGTAITTTPAITKTTTSSGGGMFGSFLGKAAAAVQSATNVVNQGASMATAVVQKVPAAAAATAAAAVAVAASPSTTTVAVVPNTCSASTTTDAHKILSTVPASTGYDLLLQNDYNNQLLAHQDSLSSQYSTTGDDYENSNLIVYTTSPSFINHRNDKPYTNYYSNGNHSQQQQQMKLLPTVPPVGSTGKKLPTINGKSGYLIKQQPTEIFDFDENDDLDLDIDIVIGDDDDDDELVNVVGHEPNYRIDSEQNDYYMDHQPTTPSTHATMPANGYYEHTNGGYDYREDYFNEEDEYKYLEKEEAQKAQEELLYQQQQRQQHGKQPKLLLHEKQSSLEYVDDVHEHDNDHHIDDYIDDNYPSEDSGNYLDESSSGSVGVGVGVSMVSKSELAAETDPAAIAAAAATKASARATAASIQSSSKTATTVLHQQIKKQDSIIMEEDEDELSGLNEISHVLSRKSSNILLDDDQLIDLSLATHLVQTKKKVLMRGETEEVVGGHMLQMIRKSEVTAKQRWHWAYNKIIMQLNVSNFYIYFKI